MADRIITQDEFIAAVENVLVKRGEDFVYDENGGECLYSVDGGETGSCLFGAALIDELHVPYHNGWEQTRIYDVIRALSGRGVQIPLDTVVAQAMFTLQSEQDDGQAYGKVRSLLHETLEDLGLPIPSQSGTADDPESPEFFDAKEW